MRVLVTGSRDWTDEEAIEVALAPLGTGGEPVTIVHGACPTGADAIAHKIALRYGYEVEPHPADWTTHGRAAGPIRNQEMVDLGADLCLAFPLSTSRGTWDCVRRAIEADITLTVRVP